jgi:hypothetical protein
MYLRVGKGSTSEAGRCRWTRTSKPTDDRWNHGDSRVLGGVYQHSYLGTGRGRHRFGGHRRCKRDRTSWRHADQREIDTLESIAIRPVPYLVSTRIVAAMIAITRLYAIAVILSFVRAS